MTRRKAARIANGVTVEMELPLVGFVVVVAFLVVVAFMVVVLFIATVGDIFISLPDFDAAMELLAEAVGIIAVAAIVDDSCLLIAFELVAAMIVDGIGAWAVPQK